MKSRTGTVLLAFGVLLVVALAVNTVVVGSETKKAKADVGKIMKLPGGDLQVREDGPAGAPAIVLIHGFASSLHWWDKMTPLLDKDHRVIRLDLLGHGGSEKPKSGYSIEAQASLVDLALRRLHVQKALVVGHSMGADVALALAKQDRSLVRGIVNVDEAPSADYGDLGFTAQLGFVPVVGEAIYTTVPDSQIKDGLQVAFAKGYEVPQQFVEDFKKMTHTAYTHSASENFDFLDREHLDQRVRDLGIPVLVIYGSEDRLSKPVSKAAATFRRVPGVKVVIVKGAGHSPHVEKPQQTAKLVLSFDRSLNGP